MIKKRIKAWISVFAAAALAGSLAACRQQPATAAWQPASARQVQEAASPESGKTSPESGGTSPESGGTSPESGGTSPESGGTSPESGGTSPESGGTSPESGGISPESGEQPQGQLSPLLDRQSAEIFIAEALSTLTLDAGDIVRFELPEDIPCDPQRKTELFISMNATYVLEPGSYRVERLLDNERGWQGGRSFSADLSGGDGRLHEIMLRAAFMTDIGEGRYKQLCGDYVTLTAPFDYGSSIDFGEAETSFEQEGRRLTAFYTTQQGKGFEIALTLPENILAAAPEGGGDNGGLSPFSPIIITEQSGAAVGSFVPVRYGVTDAGTLATVEPARDEFPMQIYSPVALSNMVDWRGKETVYLPAGNGGSVICAPELSGEVIADCILAYSLDSEPYFLYLTLERGALTAEQLFELAGSIEFLTEKNSPL